MTVLREKECERKRVLARQRRACETFVDAVRRGETIEPSFRRAAELQRVLDLAFESDQTGRAVRVAEGAGAPQEA